MSKGVRGSLKAAPVTKKLCEKRLSWYDHVVRKLISMNGDGYNGGGDQRNDN